MQSLKEGSSPIDKLLLTPLNLKSIGYLSQRKFLSFLENCTLGNFKATRAWAKNGQGNLEIDLD